MSNKKLLQLQKKIAVFLKAFFANSLREDVRMLVFRPDILHRQVSRPHQLTQKLVPYIDVLTVERKGILAKSIAPLLSSNTPILGDPRLGIRKNNTPLT